MSEEIKDIILDVKDSLNETPKNMYKYNKITLNLNEFEEILNYIEQLEKEIDRLNNIINELEKWLIKHIDEYRDMEQDAMFEFGLVLDKLKALKENNKE